MVVSGIPLVTASHAQEVADMSLDLVEACRNFIIPHMPGEPLRIRVGLHSGTSSPRLLQRYIYTSCVL
ncbi:hypothetical protein DPMN_082950 [Dreissena polymorpha]|uniref:Guanylate cyclase domain-containing protein n=1 Tax=Dreissena polymorpha TaxID=45954 RepID=A0A9D3YBR2_DREPO|nr:hypothetical protein DPMN_082950 [Dreissena polymorpha]